MEYNTAESLDNLEKSVFEDFGRIKDADSAEKFRLKYLSKKGLLRSLLKGLKDMPEDKRRKFGARANKLRGNVEKSFNERPWEISGRTGSQRDNFDPTLPGYNCPGGGMHPLEKIKDQICRVFFSMGFDSAYGPEAESDYYNFEALNFPPHHPARDMQDTFFLSDKTMLRTHTSPVQIRVMEQKKPPLRCIMPGRVYRNEEISSRSYCMFEQIEGLYIDKNVSMADLKGTLYAFAKRFFDEKAEIKFRPSYFPFTEPSVEVDVKCFLCSGKGCSVCKQTGWLEILGAGMVHPNVLKSGGIDSEKYTGFAFGMGIDRIALTKLGIDDIRLLYENDVRLLKQFQSYAV